MPGELEQLLLLALMRVGPDADARTLARELKARAGRQVLLATVHRTLARLEEKGLVASRMGEPTARRGGRRRRHFAITTAGREAAGSAVEAVRRLASGLELGWDRA